MVALCGAVSWREGPASTLDLGGVQRILAPYGQGRTWNGTAGSCAVALGVQEPRTGPGSRPAMVEGAGGTLVVCADATLSGRDELAQRLGLPTSVSDADVALAAYDRWGRSFLQQLSGSFALAVVDRRRGGVLLARDHAGRRTLSVHERDGVVAFASTALALTGFPGVGHDLDLDRAVEVMLLAYSTDRTFVRGVRTVLPGTAMWIDSDGARAWRWWLPDGSPIVDAGSLSAHASALRERLEDAVAGSLTDAGNVGVMLSGGLDSTSVAAVAARRLAPRTLTSYTSVPPAGWAGPTQRGWIPSERFAVEALGTRYPNLRPRFVEATGDSLFGHSEMLWELGSPPVRNALNIGWVLKCYGMAADEGVDVLLGGSAGNFAFSADGPMWLIELARRGRLLRMAGEAWKFSKAFDIDIVKVLRRDLLAHAFPGVQRRRAVRGGADPRSQWLEASAVSRDRLAGVDLDAMLPELSDPHPRALSRDAGRMFLNFAAQAELFAAVQARWGVELRDPTADRRVVELAVTQPEWWRRHNGEWRAIARAAMRDALPPEIVDRPTSGAQQPDWFDQLTTGRAEVIEELDALRSHPASCEVIDVATLDRLVRDWPDRSRMADPHVVNGYQLALSRSLFLSRYLRWFEERGRRVNAGGPAVVLDGAG